MNHELELLKLLVPEEQERGCIARTAESRPGLGKLQPEDWPSVFVNKVLLAPAMLIRLHIVCGCFQATMAEGGS